MTKEQTTLLSEMIVKAASTEQIPNTEIIDFCSKLAALDINSVKSKSKINPYDFVSKDKSRPIMAGVFHQNGYRVASDGICLIAIQETYPEQFEGKVLAKDNTEIQGKYPNWESVIPSVYKCTYDGHLYREYIINLNEVQLSIRQFKKGKRLEGVTSITVSINGISFKDSYFLKLLDFMNVYPNSKLYLVDNRRCALVTDGDNKMILMPCRVAECNINIDYTID